MFLFSKLFALLSLLAVGAHGETIVRRANDPEVLDNELVGGSEASFEDEFHFVVKIEEADGAIDCTGALIYEDVVLTTARCLSAGTPSVVTIGSSRDNPGRTIEVCNSRAYDLFKIDPVNENDIGAIKLCDRVDECDAISYNTNTSYPEVTGQDLTVIGYGNEDILEKLTVQFVNKTECQSLPGFGSLIPSQHICARSTVGGGICSGDSGAPLFDSTRTLVGLGSFIFQECGALVPDVYTDVASFRGWIDDRICEFAQFPPRRCDAPDSLLGIVADTIQEASDHVAKITIGFIDGLFP